jgi:integrase
MRWADIDLDAGLWLVPAEWSKNKRELAVPLAAEAVRILRERRSRMVGADYVWPSSESATGYVVNPEKPWRRVLKRAGVTEHTTLHDIRRTLASRLAMDGVAATTIQKAMAHMSPQSLKHYAHLDAQAGRDAIDKASASVIKPKFAREE